MYKYLVLTGPESTGKSTLAHHLSVQYQMPLVEEYARLYLDAIKRKYTYGDLEKMAKKQLAMEWERSASPNVICDTDILTFIIWSLDKYRKSPKWYNDFFQAQHNRFYLLCQPDIEWAEDPMRENPEDRDRLFRLYENCLIEHNKPYTIISGIGEERIESVDKIVKDLLE